MAVLDLVIWCNCITQLWEVTFFNTQFWEISYFNGIHFEVQKVDKFIICTTQFKLIAPALLGTGFFYCFGPLPWNTSKISFLAYSCFHFTISRANNFVQGPKLLQWFIWYSKNLENFASVTLGLRFWVLTVYCRLYMFSKTYYLNIPIYLHWEIIKWNWFKWKSHW